MCNHCVGQESLFTSDCQDTFNSCNAPGPKHVGQLMRNLKFKECSNKIIEKGSQGW